MDPIPGNGSTETRSTGRHFYSMSMENNTKRRSNLKSIVLMQIFILFVFIIGLTAGLLLGIFVYHKNADQGTTSKSSHIHPVYQSQHANHRAKIDTTTDRPNFHTTSRPLHKTSPQLHNKHHMDDNENPFPGNLSLHAEEKFVENISFPHEHLHIHEPSDHKKQPIKVIEKNHVHVTDSGHVFRDHSMDSSSPHTDSSHILPQWGSQPSTVNGYDLSSIPLETVLDSNVHQTPCTECHKRNPFVVIQRQKLYAPLSTGEMTLAYDIMLEKSIINYKSGEIFDPRSNFISYVDLTPPNKQDALKFLENKGQFPGRYATVVVNKGAEDPPYVMEYKVGPLDGHRRNISIVPKYRVGEVPYYKRPYDSFEMQTLLSYIYDHLESLKGILGESFDAPEPQKHLNVIPVGPYEIEGEGKRITRFSLAFKGLGALDMDFVSAIPFSAKVNHESLNVSEWSMYDFMYVNQGPFKNSSYLYTYYVYNLIKKVTFPPGSREAISMMVFPQRDGYLPQRQFSEFSGPQTYETSGPRYTIEDHDISWLGWDFSVLVTAMRGPAIFNIRFKGERIVYENSLNDIALVYGADDPSKDNVVYNDCEFGMGSIPTPLRGTACPDHGVVLNITTWEPMKQVARSHEAICVFEKDGQEALWRHNGKDFNVGLRNRFLVVRFSLTIANYDYTFDYEFYLDGKMTVRAIATGFIFGGFFNPFTENFGSDGKSPFGYKIGSFVTGLIHDHNFGFKVDMDIVDSNNTFEVIHWKVGDVEEATTSRKKNVTVPDYFFNNLTRYIEWEPINKEQGFKISSENQKFWTVVNNERRNYWNVSRGYRIVPMATGSQNFREDYTLFDSIAFTKNHFTITRRKEEEQFMKPPFRYFKNENASAGLMYLEDMVNNETIDNEDIVTWISVGFLHIPTSEDVPITSRVETGFTLKPFNFFDTTATHDVPQYTSIAKQTIDFEAEQAPNCFIRP